MDHQDAFPSEIRGLPQASSPSVARLHDGDLVELRIHPVRKRIGEAEETQPPIPPGGTFDYRLRFPDPGLYWCHPHIREDFAQEMGLYAPSVVEPSDPSYWAPVDRHITVTLDDVLLESGKMAPFRRSGSTFTAMGRFGNVMLINGETHFSGEAAVGEVVRIYLVNTANTRIFNFALRGARI